MLRSGEALPRDVADLWSQGRKLVNGYGPTETAVTATRIDIHPGDPISIGRPIANTFAVILRDDGEEAEERVDARDDEVDDDDDAEEEQHAEGRAVEVIDAAEVDLDRGGEVHGQAFSLLFAYISGANRGVSGASERVAMTVPVDVARPERIAMTAPVETGPIETAPHDRMTRMRFFLILPEVWASTSWPLSSFTRNMALGSSSFTTPANSIRSSFGIVSPSGRGNRPRRCMANGRI